MDVIGTQEEKNNFHNFCIEVWNWSDENSKCDSSLDSNKISVKDVLISLYFCPSDELIISASR
jgi:hypothetical protein